MKNMRLLTSLVYLHAGIPRSGNRRTTSIPRPSVLGRTWIQKSCRYLHGGHTNTSDCCMRAATWQPPFCWTFLTHGQFHHFGNDHAKNGKLRFGVCVRACARARVYPPYCPQRALHYANSTVCKTRSAWQAASTASIARWSGSGSHQTRQLQEMNAITLYCCRCFTWLILRRAEDITPQKTPSTLRPAHNTDLGTAGLKTFRFNPPRCTDEQQWYKRRLCCSNKIVSSECRG
jgi:hypothetical protein